MDAGNNKIREYRYMDDDDKSNPERYIYKCMNIDKPISDTFPSYSSITIKLFSWYLTTWAMHKQQQQQKCALFHCIDSMGIPFTFQSLFFPSLFHHRFRSAKVLKMITSMNMNMHL